jgi:DNA-binding beta-propeller fold protein YncE
MRDSTSSGARRRRAYMKYLCAAAAIAMAIAASALQAAPFGYIAKSQDASNGSILVFDAATNTIVAEIPVNSRAPGPVRVSPDGTRVLVRLLPLSFGGPEAIAVIDAATNTQIAEISLPIGPQDIAIAPDSKRAYVLTGTAVLTIDLASNSIIGEPISVDSPTTIAVTPDGKRVLVPAFKLFAKGIARIAVIDTVTHTVSEIPLPREFQVTAFAADANKIVGVRFDTDPQTFRATAILVFDLTRRRFVGKPFAIGPDENIARVSVTPDGRWVMAVAQADFFSNLLDKVRLIDTRSDPAAETTLSTGSDSRLTFSADSRRMYFTDQNRSPGLLRVVNLETKAIASALDLGGSVFSMAPPEFAIPIAPSFVDAALTPQVKITRGPGAHDDRFEMKAELVLGIGSDGINPPAEVVSLQLGPHTFTLPIRSFVSGAGGTFLARKVTNDATLAFAIRPLGGKRYQVLSAGKSADLGQAKNPLPVTLTIGSDRGTKSVKAIITTLAKP